MNEIQKAIYTTIQNLFEERIKKLKFDYTLTGKVVSIATDNKSAMVEINGNESKCLIKDGIAFIVGDIVLITVIQNDYSRKVIYGKIGTKS